MRITLALATTLLLVGCGTSPKTQYHMLDTIPGMRAPVRLSQPVVVAAVRIPPSLDRREMVLSEGANSVQISGTDRWAGPLGSMTRRVLSQDLAARLMGDMVIMPDAPAPSKATRIVVTLSQFGPQPDGSVALGADWSVVAPISGDLVLRRDVHFTASDGARDGNAVAAAMSRLLDRLADDIVATLARREHTSSGN